MLQTSTMVGGPHKQVDKLGKASTPLLGHLGVACTAVERLSFTCRGYAALQIARIKGGS